MDCRTAASRIQDYLSENLSYRERKEFIRHIASCPKCRNDAELMLIFRAADERLKDHDETDFDFSRLIGDRIRAEEKTFRRRKRFFLAVVSLFSLFLILVFITLMIYIGR